MTTPKLRVVGTGGTIASTDADGPGKTPSKSTADLVADRAADAVAVDVEEVCRVSGFQMTISDVAAVADAVERAATDGVDGVVVTHGTDTMAETAYLLAVACEATSELPVVCTGAQRPADQLGTDGPSNLDLAVEAAVSDRLREAGGAYVAFDDELHAARWVVKRHTTALDTFTSPGAGPIAERTPAGLRYLRAPGRYVAPLPAASIEAAADVRVEIVTNATGVDGRQVERALADGAGDGGDDAVRDGDESSEGVDGFVLAGTGLGNATGALGEALVDAIDVGVPVVCCSRCYGGTTAGLYGGPGGGATLRAAGAIGGGDLPAWKARLRLALALTVDADLESVRAAFDGIDSVA